MGKHYSPGQAVDARNEVFCSSVFSKQQCKFCATLIITELITASSFSALTLRNRIVFAGAGLPIFRNIRKDLIGLMPI